MRKQRALEASLKPSGQDSMRKDSIPGGEAKILQVNPQKNRNKNQDLQVECLWSATLGWCTVWFPAPISLLWTLKPTLEGTMAALVALCSGLGKRKFTCFPAGFVCLTNPGTHAVLWRSCSQYKQVTSNEDLPIPVENPYKEPLKNVSCVKSMEIIIMYSFYPSLFLHVLDAFMEAT